MYIDSIAAEINSEADWVETRENAYFSVRNAMTEYVPNWEMTSEREGKNDSDQVKAERTDSTNA